MPRAISILAWTLAALCGSGCATHITKASLHAEVDRHICAVWSPEVEQWGGPLFDEQCPRPPQDSELTRVVQSALVRMRPMLMLSEAAGRSFDVAVQGQPASAQASADTYAREAFWRDPELSRAMTLALREALQTRGARCRDCPSVGAPPPLTLPWTTFEPYLSAYIWPHDGEGGGVEIHTCSGINGAAALNPDPRLQHAGVLTAFAFATDEAMAAQIHRIAATSPSVPAAATALQTVLNAPSGRAHACAALADIEWFTGLRIAECAGQPPP